MIDDDEQTWPLVARETRASRLVPFIIGVACGECFQPLDEPGGKCVNARCGAEKGTSSSAA